jgi:CubicO group peptidase (beta-lactamase class C family)
MVSSAVFLLVVGGAASSVRGPLGADENPMAAEIQAILDNITFHTNYSLSFGYLDTDGLEIALAAGPTQPPSFPPTTAPGKMTPQDTMQMGSGTKPFTATAVMQLVDKGKVKLSDLVSDHVDGPLKAMWNTTFVGLFGSPAAKVTVDMLLRMNSGLGDFEGEGSHFDLDVLANGTKRPDVVHSPLESFNFVSSLPPLSPTCHRNCVFVCEPGTCYSYSTVNFMVGGLILLAHAPPGKQTWQTFDHFAALGLDRSDFPNLHFPPLGTMSKVGLSTVGGSRDYGQDFPIFSQDQSIMSWTGGYAVSAAFDIAKFLFQLLVPGHMKLVSAANVAVMQNVSALNADSYYQYGFGLMHGTIGGADRHHPPKSEVGKFSGHDGITYGFSSNNGYFPALNATVSTIVNQDTDFFFSRNIVTCPILEVIAKHKGLGDVDLQCMPLSFVCEVTGDGPAGSAPICTPDSFSSGGGSSTKAACMKLQEKNSSQCYQQGSASRRLF